MPIKEKYPYYLANDPVFSEQSLDVIDKYTQKKVSSVSIADAKTIHLAIHESVLAAKKMEKLPPYKRQEILNFCVEQFKARKEELAYTLCIEAGKTITDSRGEVARLIDTFRIAAEESVRIYGEVIPLEVSERAKGYFGMWKRFPVGPCSFITPFNFPLNLVAHKVAPAIAAGCPFILKPASRTPIGALIIGEILSKTELPKGAFSILPCSRDGADLFTTDDRLKLLSFTGSPEVGWELKKNSGKKKVVLELGGNAGCIVDEDADVEDAVKRILIGAFYQSGQSCIKAQRVLVHEKIYQIFKDKFIVEAQKLKCGDPKEEDTYVGPLISEAEAKRVEKWVEEAKAAGAILLCGGKRQGSLYPPTVLEKVPKNQKVCQEEIFGPVVVLSPFQEFRKAIDEVNEGRFGLQTGIFTRDIFKAKLAWEELEVGGVIIGDVPSWRVDNMPYGGVKDSGLGREGVRFAIEDMTEIRLFVIRDNAN